MPTLDLDLYADDVLRDSRVAFARIREAGPVVWLPRHKLYAVGRFETVRTALRADDVFISGDGVAANPVANRAGAGTTLFSDGDLHDRQRKILKAQLGPGALKDVRPRIDALAEQVVAGLWGRRQFDAVGEFSSRLPLGVVAELVGVRGGDRMLRWAAAMFNMLGPFNRRALASVPASLSLMSFAQRMREGSFAPGSWAAAVFAARDRGEISSAQARGLIIDFVSPSLDTTILASTAMLSLLSENPEAWTAVRADPELIGTAVLESVRIASPIRGFTRRVAVDHELDGVALAKGSRVVLLYGAANLDETRFPDPERFDLGRANHTHLGWGNGPHACVGSHLAKLEMASLLRAMLPRVTRVRAWDARRLTNNTLQGISGLQASFE